MNRKALIIGVENYEDENIPNLPVVTKDLNLIQNVLESSGYQVTSISGSGEKTVGISKIRHSISKICTDAEAQDTLLIYFSGHGLHYKGVDYLVPGDAVTDQAEDIETYLVSIDFSQTIERSKSETIVFFIDACREGLDLVGTNQKAFTLKQWGKGKRELIKKKAAAYVFSCSAGDFSRYVADGSFFTRALEHSLSIATKPKTFREVVDLTQVSLDNLTRQAGVGAQLIQTAVVGDRKIDLDNRTICEGRAKTRSKPRSKWTEYVSETNLWEIAGHSGMVTTTSLKPLVEEMVAQLEMKTSERLQQFPSLYWIDMEYPSRMLDRLEFYLSQLPNKNLRLYPEESAVLILVSYFYYSHRINTIAELHAAITSDASPKSSPVAIAVSYEAYLATIPQLTEKKNTLRRENDPSHEIVAMWLISKWIGRRPIPNFDLHESVQNYVGQVFEGTAIDRINATLVVSLTTCILQQPARISEFMQNVPVTSPKEGEITRNNNSILGYLVATASQFAIDVASLSDIIIENVGAIDPIEPEKVIEVISKSAWTPKGSARCLVATCDHPAVDYALHKFVKCTNEFLSSLHNLIEQNADFHPLIHALPNVVTSEGVLPRTQDGLPIYRTPHLQFELSQSEVRSLLMGQRLYRDPSLAIRELYQNALDACRYREARYDYLKRTGSPKDRSWRGRIEFEHGIDENGRSFLECRDNGIGMTEEILIQCFARAGKRFVDSEEYLAEQSDWKTAEPPISFSPNSQFGIGVFSYFMLADEVHILTRRMERDGSLSQHSLWVTVASGASLFRVRPIPSTQESGTRVRLYLKTELSSVSASSTLAQLLRLAQYHTTVIEKGEALDWDVDVLYYDSSTQESTRDRSNRISISAEESISQPEAASSFSTIQKTDNPNVWWLQKQKGALLVDGIVTNRTISFAVINLSTDYGIRLTVDRRTVTNYDKYLVEDLLSEQLPSLCVKPSWLDYEWLWNFGEHYPRLGDELAHLMVGKSIKLLFAYSDENGERRTLSLSVRDLGCFPPDRTILPLVLSEKDKDIREFPPWLKDGRVARIKWAISGSTDCLSVDEDLSLPSGSEWLEILKGLKGRVSIENILKLSLVSKYSARKVASTILKFAKVMKLHLERTSVAKLPDVIFSESDAPLLKCNCGYSVRWALIRIANQNRESVIVSLMRLRIWFAALRIDEPSSDVFADLRVPDSLDLKLIAALESGRRPWLQAPLGAYEMVVLSAQYAVPQSRVREAFIRYKPVFDLRIDVETDVDLGAESQPDDRRLLSRRLNGQAPWLEGKVSIGHILRASILCNLAPMVIVGRLRLYADPLQFALPDNLERDLPPGILDPEDQLLLSRSLNPRRPWPWISGNLPIGHVYAAAGVLNRDSNYVLERLGMYGRLLGFRMDWGNPKNCRAIGAKHIATILSKDGDGKFPWLSGKVKPKHVLITSAICSLGPRQVVEVLLHFADSARMDLSLIRDVEFPDNWLEGLAAVLSENRIASGGASKAVMDAIASVISMEASRECDVTKNRFACAPTAAELLGEDTSAWRVIRDKSGVSDFRFDATANKVSSAEFAITPKSIVSWARQRGISLRASLVELRAVGVLLAIETSKYVAAELCDNDIDEKGYGILVDLLGELRDGSVLSYQNVMRVSLDRELCFGEILDQVRKLVGLFDIGAVCAQLEDMSEKRVTEFEWRLISGSGALNLNRPISRDELPGLLIDAALSYGRPLVEIVDVFSRYAPALNFESDFLPKEIAEKMVVKRNDCVLLSKHLNGERPWISEVSEEQLKKAAERTEQSVESLRGRVNELKFLGVRIAKGRTTRSLRGVEGSWS